MKIQRIYVDTSVIGGCFDSEFDKWSNSLINNFRDSVFRAVVSEVTATEISEAPNHVKEKYAELLSYNTEVIEISEESIKLAELYQSRDILSNKSFDDGLHIAIATITEIDLLVSWNFKHIVHFDKIRLFNSVNIEQGYKSINIYSPREVTYYEEWN